MVPPFLTTLGFAALRFLAPAQELVQPTTYASPSGALELLVDPSRRDGAGAARYRMTRGEEQLFEEELPFTLRAALVREDGTTAGFGYQDGEYRDGVLRVVVLAPDGSVRAEERLDRLWTVPHGAPDPTGIALRHDGERFALEVCGWLRESKRWWTYEWATCRRVDERHEPPQGAEEPPPHVAGWNAAVVGAGEFPGLALEAFHPMSFDWPVRTRSAADWNVPDAHRERRPHSFFVDERGVWISELSTRIVHVFDADGRALHECIPHPKTFRPHRPCEWLAVRRDGSVFLYGDGAIEAFDPRGASSGWTPDPSSSGPRRRWLFQPGRDERWEVGPFEIVLIGAAGETALRAERGANGRFFNGLWDACVAPDGALAVIDEPNEGIVTRDPSTWVHVFAPTGEPRRSLRVPGGFDGGKIAYDGRRLALLNRGELLLCTEEGRALGRGGVPCGTAVLDHVFLPPATDELWVSVRGEARLLRFGLPTE